MEWREKMDDDEEDVRLNVLGLTYKGQTVRGKNHNAYRIPNNKGVGGGGWVGVGMGGGGVQRSKGVTRTSNGKVGTSRGLAGTERV